MFDNPYAYTLVEDTDEQLRYHFNDANGALYYCYCRRNQDGIDMILLLSHRQPTPQPLNGLRVVGTTIAIKRDMISRWDPSEIRFYCASDDSSLFRFYETYTKRISQWVTDWILKDTLTQGNNKIYVIARSL